MKDDIKLPPQIASDPFWTKSHIRPRTTFGHSPKARTVKVDARYNVKNDINNWKYLDEYGTQHKRLQVESVWGKFTSPPAPGEYNPDHEKLSKRESFPAFTFPKRTPDKFFEELEFKRAHPMKAIGGLPDHFAPKKSVSAVETGPSASSDLQKISAEDMKKSLLPGPGQYGGDYHKIERFERPGVARMTPKTPVAIPRPVVDRTTMKILTMAERRQMFDGSYYSASDPTKKSVVVHPLGARRPMYGQHEDSSPGPGAYTLDPVQHIGSGEILSSTHSLQVRKDKTVKKYAKVRVTNYKPIKSFGRKSLVS
ncbi:hypothetical protein EON65_29565 [archaeon]|nr:MAG: hypothetical protein EON65_29565 [archaeon]